MAYTKETNAIRNDLHTAWTKIRAAIGRMYPSAQIRPSDATDVFVPDVDEDLRFDAGPVVFHLPDKAKRPTPTLYVVIKGWIAFGPPGAGDPRRRTVDFGTQVGYFQHRGEQLAHVYGAHYDMDRVLIAHPVFHQQLCSQAALRGGVDDQFRTEGQELVDFASHLLGNVRTPTAQMDVFAVITQVCADHLISSSSNKEVQTAFAQLRQSCDFFTGAGWRLGHLSSRAAASCYRSTHWYEREP